MNSDLIRVLFLMALVTYLPRALPVLFLSRRPLPAFLTRWLAYIPVAVLAALLGPLLLIPGKSINLSPVANSYFWVSLPVLAVALRTRNMFVTVIFGMLLMAGWRAFC